MTSTAHATTHVVATVLQVRPVTGLAYVQGADHRSWAITKSTTGPGFATLVPGHRVDLTVESNRDFDFVSAYAPLD